MDSAARGETSELQAGDSVSHYIIKSELNRGGMGIVYQAHDTMLKRSVALKVLPPELVCDPDRKERFVREARAAAARNHPNIATIYEYNEVGGIPLRAELQTHRACRTCEYRAFHPRLRASTWSLRPSHSR